MQVTFFRDRRPESMSRYPGGGVKPAGQGKAAKTGAAKPGVRGRGGKRAAPGARGATSRAGSSSTASAARSTRTNATDPNFGRNAFAVREAADHMVDHAAGAGAGAGRVPATAGGVSGGPVPSHRGQRAGTDAPNDSTAQVSEAGSKGGKGSAPNRVLRTVYLPSERADALLMTVQSLQQQLAENKRLMEDRVQTWRRDRKEREEAWRNKANADQLKIAALEKQIASSAEKLHAGTRGACGRLLCSPCFAVHFPAHSCRAWCSQSTLRFATRTRWSLASCARRRQCWRQTTHACSAS